MESLSFKFFTNPPGKASTSMSADAGAIFFATNHIKIVRPLILPIIETEHVLFKQFLFTFTSINKIRTAVKTIEPNST